MTWTQAQDVTEWIRESGVSSVVLGGNEPIYAGSSNVQDSFLPALIDTLSDAGIRVSVVTSGLTAVLLERRWPEAFARLAAVAVSLDAPTAERHNASRGAPLFGLAANALKLCQAYEVPGVVLVTGMQWNFSPADLAGFCDIARAYQAYIRVNIYKSVRGLADPLSVTPPQYQEGFQFLVTETTSVLVEEPPIRPWFGLPEKLPNCGHKSGRLTLPDSNRQIKFASCQYRSEFARDLPMSAINLLEDDTESPQCIDYKVYYSCRQPSGIVPLAPDPAMEIFGDYLCTWVGRP